MELLAFGLVARSGRGSYRRRMRNHDLEIVHEIVDTRGGFGHRARWHMTI
jgi:hypothetical protein